MSREARVVAVEPDMAGAKPDAAGADPDLAGAVAHVAGAGPEVAEVKPDAADAAPDVVIVGGGPAGLTAARELRRAGVAEVVVVEREEEVGGIPRHADHQGYGLRDLHRSMTGPRYARLLAERAREAGAGLVTSTQVTALAADGRLDLTGPGGRTTLHPRSVVLATGCRERPRPARWVPGSRPRGVFTTGTLQQAVYLNRERVRGRAIVVGAEHVAFSALQTLRHAGAEPVAMTTERADHESYAAFRLGASLGYRVPLLRHTRVERIVGGRTVEAVELLDLESGQARHIPCDMVVFTGDWIPDHELARGSGVGLDPATKGPLVDPAMRTDRPGVFAVGNLLHGAETADVAALSGRRAAVGVLAHLAGAPWPTPVPILCESPLTWIVPGAISLDPRAAAPPAPFRLRAADDFTLGRLEISQAGRILARPRFLRIGPSRSATVGPDWVSGVDLGGGPVRFRLTSGRRVRA